MNGPIQSYASMADAAIVEKNSKQQKWFPLRPSSAGKCSRLLAYELMAYKGKGELVEEQRRPSVWRLLELGHYVEDQTIANLEKIPEFAVRFKQQLLDFFVLPSGQRVEGSTDAVMWSDKHRCVLDVKSVGDRFHSQFGTKWRGMLAGYSKMQHCVQFDTNSFYIENLPAFIKELGSEDSLYDNLLQVNSYCCTPFMQARDVDHGVVLRYNKNTSELSEIRFKPSMELFEALKAQFTAIEAAVEANNPDAAPKDFILGSVKCAYCPMQSHCWPKATKGEVFANSPKKNWATPVADLEKGEEIEVLLAERTKHESSKANMAKVDESILLLMDGHGVTKIKAKDGSVYDKVQLAKEVQLRRGKE